MAEKWTAKNSHEEILPLEALTLIQPMKKSWDG
jgi:hypothetical protein